MSRIGKLPIPVPDGVDVVVDDGSVRVRGPRGELTQALPSGVRIEREDGVLHVHRESDEREHRARHGLVRSLVANMIEGVTTGYSKTLELVGVGYRAAAKGAGIEVQVGYSHPVAVDAPAGIELAVPAPNRIVVSGIDKVLVGQTAANIRKIREPEPYKGKGIKYEGERIRRKAGKAAAR